MFLEFRGSSKVKHFAMRCYMLVFIVPDPDSFFRMELFMDASFDITEMVNQRDRLNAVDRASPNHYAIFFRHLLQMMLASLVFVLF